MAMPVEVKDISVGDIMPAYGTVTKIKEIKNAAGDVIGINFDFFNGGTLTNVKPDLQMSVLQDGANIIHNGMPDSSEIRSGLKADHAKD